MSGVARQAELSAAGLAQGGSGTARRWWRAGWLTDCLDEERDRWFLWVPVCFGLGIAAYFALPVEPTLAVVATILVVAMVVSWLTPRATVVAASIGMLLSAAGGFAIAKVRTEWVRAPVLERQLTNVEVRGFVELIEPKAARGQRLTIWVNSIAGVSADKTPKRVRVRVLNPGEPLKPGEGIVIKATLAAPAEPSAPGAFDFGRTAWFSQLGGVGYAMSAATLDTQAGPMPWQLWSRAGIAQVRQRIGRAVVAALPGEAGGIANALITGERGGISAETDKAYRDSGLYHILSISGLHMVVMAGAFFFAIRFVLAAIPGIALRYPIKSWAAIAAAIAALGYLLISGSAFATVRSYLMISILFLAIVMERPALALRNVAVAAMLLLVIWPESLFDAGFQMSFAAVVALISVYEAVRARELKLGRANLERGPIARFGLFFAGILGSTLIATVAVAPIAAYQFHASQQYGMVSNLLALPICDLIVMPALLATLLAMPFGLEAGPLWVAGLGIDIMSAIARRVAELPGAVVPVAAIPMATFGLLIAGGLWLALWRTRWRLLGLPVMALGLAVAPTLVRPDVLIGRDGSLIAARIDAGRLSALPAPRGLFELSRWLETDGDGRTAKSVANGAKFRCDGVGCTAVVQGQLMVVTRHASTLADDCARAAIVVLNRARPKACMQPRLVLDARALRVGGAHAVYVEAGGRLRVETVANLRGDRPWSPARTFGARVRSDVASVDISWRLRQFTALGERLSANQLRSGWPRPEDEDDETLDWGALTGGDPTVHGAPVDPLDDEVQ